MEGNSKRGNVIEVLGFIYFVMAVKYDSCFSGSWLFEETLCLGITIIAFPSERYCLPVVSGGGGVFSLDHFKTIRGRLAPSPSLAICTRMEQGLSSHS